MKKLVYIIVLTIICLIWDMNLNKVFSQESYLVVLDIQEFPLKSKEQENSVQEMIQNVNILINHFNPENVIYIKATGRVLNISLKGFYVDTIPAREFDNNLHVVSNNIFSKVEGDAFTSSDFTTFLEDNKTRKIVLVGLMAEKCLYDTALGGKARGYDINIVSEGIVGTTPKKKEKAIKKMKEKGIKTISINDIINTL